MQEGLRGLQTSMAAGRTSSRQLVEAAMARIEAIDRSGPMLGSILEVNPDASAIAEGLDRERTSSSTRGPLHGIPVVIKANIDTADGMTTTAGSLALAGSMPAKDAFLVTQLREAGAVILGKANLSEWANFRGRRSVSGWSSQGGQTRNPYDPRRSPCGSSSGSAVAVAAEICALAVGTETDGSIVCPAQTCGIVGIKPTLGWVSRSGIVPIAHSQDTAGPMARCVEDAAILLDVLAGYDPEDAATAEVQSRSGGAFAEGLDPEALRGARIGVARSHLGAHPKIDAIFESSLDVLRTLGAQLVDPANIENDGAWSEAELEVLLYEFKHDLNGYLASLGDRAPVRSLEEIIAFNAKNAERVLPHFGQELMEMAQEKGPLTDKAYLEARETCLRMTRREGIDALFVRESLDALVSPTGGPAWLIDEVLGDLWVGGRISSAPAVAGTPHVTVPAGLIEGLPIGLSFVGRAWDDARLIRFAFAYEQATLFRSAPKIG